MQRPTLLDAPGTAKELLEISFELKHVRQFRGSNEGKPAVIRQRHVAVPDFLAQRTAQGGGQLEAGQMLASDTDPLSKK